MRIKIILLFMTFALLYAPASAAGDHIELYNIGVTVAMEEEQTTISLFLDGAAEPV